MSQGNTQFLCWKCDGLLVEFPGEQMMLSYMVTCQFCGLLNAIQYAFPLAKAVTVYPEELRRPEGGEDR